MSLTTGTTIQSSPDWADNISYDHNRSNEHIGDWDRIETLSQQRQDAAAQYARNGDSSAFFAVLDAAAQFEEAWGPSGLGLFGPARE
jgi:hypothetical protein